MATTVDEPSLYAAAQAWRDDDPDAVTRSELDLLVEAARGGDHAALRDLADRFSGMLEFGTAGLRGALGAGPNRMNRSVVIRAAAGLTAFLQAEGGAGPAPTVVVGFDARHNSDVFARDTAAVVVAAGGRAFVLPEPLPTPVLAYAIRHLGADAGVMVTASHNPPRDNGYKVYLGDGSQIVPPSDGLIAAHIDRVDRVADVTRAADGWETLGPGLLDDYLDAVVTVLDPTSARDLSIVHTSLHGVGHATVREAFVRAGFAAPDAVGEQARPDPEFPTVAFPNPEEKGAIDLALARAREVGCDLVIANDPDADRCAAAVLDPAVGGWRMLRGDEVGALLGAHVVVRGVAPTDVFANSIVSSRLLASIAAAAGIRHEETLTGFKWISRVEGLRYGYEEALGYCVAPGLVRDKDGVSAALLLAELAAGLKAQGRTLVDLLDDLAVAHGVHATDSFSVRVSDLAQIDPLMQRLRTDAPATVAGLDVTRIDDLSRGDGGLPPTEGLRWFLADDSRVIVRPSGTEPKVKVYLEVIEPVAGPDHLVTARAEADRRLSAIRAELERLTAL
ncbi:phosphomannomutase [Intrasporangium oryzae NRRL B-24470]|uniref:Phosphomannomutase n=1 Tax=Intrasporangium oryzae NRRL B-24470 TaxID=1386089 RepID=W9G202_9MICO|nr:phospho-sugar mutase [Intrasporangium oryzae]EWT00126.1 phosphomannomutase [Intrasporangium oryzae NRRL B-24470]